MLTAQMQFDTKSLHTTVLRGHFSRDIPEGQNLLLYIRNLYVTLKLDGETVYQFGDPQERRAFHTPGITLTEDEPYTRQRQKQLQTVIDEMKHALREAGAGDIVLQEKGRLYLDVDKVDCDYYRFLQGDAAAVNSYRGEYMAEYSWGEMTTGVLSRTFAAK